VKKINDIQELRSVQLGILDHVHQFCESHNLTYFLSSGTLIGAVRHQGYIPWDDDIDIYMPRADYERFLQEYNADSHFRVLNPYKEKNYYYTFAKVVDTRTKMVETETKGYEIGIYMDIFPVDYVTENLQERSRIFRLKYLLYKIRRCKISHENYLRSKLAYYCYRLLPIPVSLLNRWIQHLIVLKQPTDTVCNMTEAGPKIKGCFPAEDIVSSVDILFEGKMYKTMVGYKDYLTRTYGDYMQLPPVEQRVTHSFEAYWL